MFKEQPKHQNFSINNVDMSPTIKKLSKIVKMGYVPQRGFEKYTLENSLVANCFEHACFNLTNRLLATFDKHDRFAFGLGMDFPNGDVVKQRMLDFVKATGLEIEPCAPDIDLKPNQWQVAFYLTEFCDTDFGDKDFHVLLQEKDKTWSAKEGFSNFVSNYNKLEGYLPWFPDDYILIETYAITNPYAKEK